MAVKRPDLEAAPFKEPMLIHKYLFPYYNREVKAGTLYYQDIVTDATIGTAITNRTLGDAPTAVRIDSASTTWALTEKIKRIKVDRSEIDQLGGLLPAQMKAARAGKRVVGNDLEAAAIAATFGDAANLAGEVDILTTFLGASDTAKETIMDNAYGQVAMFGAYKVTNRLKRYDEVVERMKFTGVLLGNVRDVRSVSDDQLAAAIGVDMVLSAPSTASASGWLGASSAYDGYLGLAVLPDPSVDPDEDIQFGRTLSFNAGTNGELFEVESYYSDDLRSEVVDVTAWTNLIALNKECAYVLKGIDEENTVTTTAS